MFGAFCRDLRDGSVNNVVSNLETYEEAVHAARSFASDVSSKHNAPVPIMRAIVRGENYMTLIHGWRVGHLVHKGDRPYYDSDNDLSWQNYIQQRVVSRSFREHPNVRYEVRVTGRLYVENEDVSDAIGTFSRTPSEDTLYDLSRAESAAWLCQIDVAQFVQIGDFASDTEHRTVKVWDCERNMVLEAFNRVPQELVGQLVALLALKYQKAFLGYEALTIQPLNPVAKSYYCFYLGYGVAKVFYDSTERTKRTHLMIETEKTIDENLGFYRAKINNDIATFEPLNLPDGTLSF